MSYVKTLTRNSLAGAIGMSGLIGLLRRFSRRSLVILCYHRVLPEDACGDYPIRELVVTPSALAVHVEYCKKHYECLPLQEAVSRVRSGRWGSKPLAAFTFDDGYWDNYEHARPILNAHGVSATFFVITSLVGTAVPPWYDRLGRAAAVLRDKNEPPASLLNGDDEASRWINERLGRGEACPVSRVVREAAALDTRTRVEVVDRLVGIAHVRDVQQDERDRIMSRQELVQLALEGHEVGSHSRSHPMLTKLTPGHLAEELQVSRHDLAQILDREIVSVCYPNGDHNDEVVIAARRAGYQYAVTTKPGLNGQSADPLRLRRVFVSQGRLSRTNGDCSKSLLALELSGAADRLFLRRLRRSRLE